MSAMSPFRDGAELETQSLAELEDWEGEPEQEEWRGLPELQRLAVERFAAEVGISVPRIGRQILTAHSGGGQALVQILEHHDPDQVHVFDALYGDPGPLCRWASKRIDRDRAALRAPGAPSPRAYMPTRGGALRVFYQGPGNRSNSLKVLDAISARRGAELKDWYRVEASTYDHFQIPRRYGWRVLSDAAADVPAASTPTTAHRETDFEAYEEEEERRPPLNDLPEPVSEASYEALEPEMEPELWKEEEHYDPHQTGNPLLDTSAPVRSTALSTSFTVGELTRSGGRTFERLASTRS